MEYPMIIFNGSSLGVTVHEFGHQWFPMMVGSNETRYGFMDEGFNGYIDAIAVSRISNTVLARQIGVPGYRRIAGTELEAPMMWIADYAGPGYGVQTYGKAPMALNVLGAVVGDSAVGRALAEYAMAWKYKHPTPYDFFFSMNKSLGKNLDWFWYEWFFTTYTLDQSIESARIVGDQVELSVRDKGDMAMPIIVGIEWTNGNRTVMTYPADVWFTGSRILTAKLPLSGRTIKSITLDPQDRFYDLDRSNNVWNAQ
jgi:hypothetical protein